jgi:hypothetical protein
MTEQLVILYFLLGYTLDISNHPFWVNFIGGVACIVIRQMYGYLFKDFKKGTNQ